MFVYCIYLFEEKAYNVQSSSHYRKINAKKTKTKTKIKWLAALTTLIYLASMFLKCEMGHLIGVFKTFGMLINTFQWDLLFHIFWTWNLSFLSCQRAWGQWNEMKFWVAGGSTHLEPHTSHSSVLTVNKLPQLWKLLHAPTANHKLRSSPALWQTPSNPIVGEEPAQQSACLIFSLHFFYFAHGA